MYYDVKNNKDVDNGDGDDQYIDDEADIGNNSDNNDNDDDDDDDTTTMMTGGQRQ